jgi:hypothetical protein
MSQAKRIKMIEQRRSISNTHILSQRNPCKKNLALHVDLVSTGDCKNSLKTPLDTSSPGA